MDEQPHTKKVERIKSLILHGEYVVEARIVAEAIMKKAPLLVRGRERPLASARVLVLHRHPARHQTIAAPVAHRATSHGVCLPFRSLPQKDVRRAPGHRASSSYRASLCDGECAA
jgi:hypothetical protein